MVDDPEQKRQRAFQVIGVGLLAVTLVGYFVEVRRPPPAAAGYSEPSAAIGLSHDARTYAELRGRDTAANRAMYVADIATLRAQLPKVTDPVVRQPGDRQAALARRAKRRAFEGAPPVVPHPMDQRVIPNCTVCHEQGAKIGELIAPMMSHQPFLSCQQCHAEENATAGALVAAKNASEGKSAAQIVPNEFTPLEFGGSGQRAWSGAPPVMPHQLWMRQRCDSCHGVSGQPGLRTTHPERQNCVQCHAPQAAVEQTLGRLDRALENTR